MTRKEWCNKHIEETIEKCGMTEKAADRLRKEVAFKEDHAPLGSLANKAMRPLIAIKDPEKQATAIKAVEKLVESKKDPETGKFKKKTTAEEVKAVVDTIVPPKPRKVVKPYEPAKPTCETGNCRIDAMFKCLECTCEWEMLSVILEPIVCPGCGKRKGIRRMNR